MKAKLTIFSILLFHLLSSQKSEFDIVNCKPVKEDFLWAGITEVSNFDYLEFLNDHKGTKKYNELLPDTNCWNLLFNRESYAIYYFRHPAYRDYPVVGLTKKQAQAYCDWLTVVLNQEYKFNSKHPVDSLIVRLPNEEEWELAAQAGNPNAIYPWQFSDMRHEGKKFKGQLLANFVRGQEDYMGVAGSLNDNADVTAPVQSYWPNAFGLYNMAGNVAEMIREEGRTKGGSWASRAKFLEIKGEDEFKGKIQPDARIGFRYFVEIVSKKDIPAKEFKLSAKTIEKMFVKVEGAGTFDIVGRTEVTNKLFNLFLKETKKSRFSSSRNWGDYISYPSLLENDYDQNSNYGNYPAIKISHQEAIDFCKWLTKKYNAFAKKKFSTVEFRLPTEEEWEYAALGGGEMGLYPWGGPYLRNSQGAFLCNHRAVYDKWVVEKAGIYLREDVSEKQLEEASGIDGAKITAYADSYHPNGYGLYNMSGNVAEMVQEKEITKGGSWYSFKKNVRIKSKEDYSGPSPLVGFRLFGEFSKN